MFAAACGPETTAPDINEADQALAADLAVGLAKACPMGAGSNDEAARLACGDNLAKFALLRDSLAEPFLWGGQNAQRSLDLAEHKLTRFNPLVWRKMYASLFMFGTDYRIETNGTQTILRVPIEFREALDVGSYPYPFWHSKGKWDNYQFAQDLILIIEDGKILGGMRSADEDRARPAVEHTFDGMWTWTTPEGMPQPANAVLYSNLFSPNNPMVAELNRTFRALEEKARSQNCNFCHSPDNGGMSSELVLLNYPNQAIYARNSIAAEIELRTMPPTQGVSDGALRSELITLAQEFKNAADQALAFEGERVSQ